MSKLTTLCYIERADEVLMLHRTKKERDVNAGKWIGVGGKFEKLESPDDCLLREVKEETGLTLLRYRCRGIVTFIYNDEAAEYMHLYTADRFSGELAESCSEGELRWVKKHEIPGLKLWAGDRIFLKLMAEQKEFFSLKLIYRGDNLQQAVLDGRPLSV